MADNIDVITYGRTLSESYLEREPDKHIPATGAVEKVGRIGMLIPTLINFSLGITAI